jgi:hypothetical protein
MALFRVGHAPDGPKEPPFRDDPAGVGHEYPEELELARREVDRRPADGDRVAERIELDRTEPEEAVGTGRRPDG